MTEHLTEFECTGPSQARLTNPGFIRILLAGRTTPEIPYCIGYLILARFVSVVDTGEFYQNTKLTLRKKISRRVSAGPPKAYQMYDSISYRYRAAFFLIDMSLSCSMPSLIPLKPPASLQRLVDVLKDIFFVLTQGSLPSIPASQMSGLNLRIFALTRTLANVF